MCHQVTADWSGEEGAWEFSPSGANQVLSQVFQAGMEEVFPSSGGLVRWALGSHWPPETLSARRWGAHLTGYTENPLVFDFLLPGPDVQTSSPSHWCWMFTFMRGRKRKWKSEAVLQTVTVAFYVQLYVITQQLTLWIFLWQDLYQRIQAVLQMGNWCAINLSP